MSLVAALQLCCVAMESGRPIVDVGLSAMHFFRLRGARGGGVLLGQALQLERVLLALAGAALALAFAISLLIVAFLLH